MFSDCINSDEKKLNKPLTVAKGNDIKAVICQTPSNLKISSLSLTRNLEFNDFFLTCYHPEPHKSNIKMVDPISLQPVKNNGTAGLQHYW